MNFLNLIFNKILYQPLFNLLIFFYYYLHDFGLSIILLTLLVRILLHPLIVRSLHSQKALTNLQPKIREIQKKYNGDRKKQSLALMELWKKEKINPFSGIFLLLVQLPVLIALFQVFLKGFQPDSLNWLYSFTPRPEKISPIFFGFLDLTKPNLGISVLAGFFHFFQIQISTQKINPLPSQSSPDLSQLIQKQTSYLLPLLTVLILFKLPTAIGLYWLLTTIFSILEYYLTFRKVYAQSS
jgi:YidC/Oxa1 family membrane protein insertase